MGPLYDLYEYPTHVVIYPFTLGDDEGSEVPEAMIFQDKDGNVCNVDIALSCYADPTMAPVLFQTYLTDMLGVVKNYCRQDLNNYFVEYSSKLTTEQLYSDQKMAMLEFVKQKMIDKYKPSGVIIVDVAFKSNIRFPGNVVAAINEKIKATQVALQKEQEVMQAEADAKKAVAKADGEAQSILMVAQAQAKANNLLSQSITSTLVSYEMAKKWNGVSPIYSGSGSAIPPIFK